MTEWRRCRENCLPCTARITSAVLASASNILFGSMGGLIASGGHGAGSDGGPGIAVEADAGVEAVADSQGIVEAAHDRTRDGRAFRTLNIIVEFTRECLMIRVKRKLNSIPSLPTSLRHRPPLELL